MTKEPELKKEENLKRNDYKGYSLFNEIESSSLQTWNRCNILMNIDEAHGKDVAIGYADALDPKSRMKASIMFKYIEIHGWEKVNAEVNRGNNK